MLDTVPALELKRMDALCIIYPVEQEKKTLFDSIQLPKQKKVDMIDTVPSLELKKMVTYFIIYLVE